MRKLAVLLFSMGLFAMSAANLAVGEDSPPVKTTEGRSVPARVIPVPTTVSPEMQTWIANPVAPLTQDAPQTADEWRAFVNAQVPVRTKLLATLRETFPCKFEPQSVGGVKSVLVTPKNLSEKNADRLVLHFHGGAYVLNPGDVGATEAVILANSGNFKVLSVDYRMPPDHPFPAALDDAVAVYQAVLKNTPPKNLAVFGTSSGGGLAAATLQKLKSLGAPMPAVLGLGTPWADLTKTGDTIFTCDDIDQVLIHYDGLLSAAAKLYAGKHDLADPLISPVNGSFAGFPPTILIAGTRDMLLSSTVRVHRKLRQAGVPAELHVFEAMSHNFYGAVPNSPESREAFAEFSQYLNAHLGQ
jgi:monoterpene epsilon-lactone hydrolase